MMQPQEFHDTTHASVPDPWSGWAQIFELPASLEYGMGDDDAAAEPAPDQEPEPAPALADAVAQLATALADERDRRSQAEDALRQAQSEARAGEVEAARLGAELAAERSRITQLERDRDEVIRRAEELLTAVRERADQRLSAELEAARRQWTDLLAEERRRVEILDGERASLLKRLEDAWLAGAVLRRSRPLRPWAPDDAEEQTGSEGEPEAGLPAGVESPELAQEIDRLRQRLRAQLHKPPAIGAVEAGVDRLREARLARDAEGRRRRPKR
jgi:hypothetical protein